MINQDCIVSQRRGHVYAPLCAIERGDAVNRYKARRNF